MPFTKTTRQANCPYLPEKSLQGKDRRTFQGKGTFKPLWDLYRDGLTQGSINLFLQCREQFRLTYWEGWSPKLGSDALEFGSCFHDCLAHMDFDKHSVQQAMKFYDKRHSISSLTSSERQATLVLRAQVAILLEAYRKFWKKDYEREWVIREETFNQLFGVVDSFSNGIPLRGRYDGIFRKGKSLWLHETKTKGRIDEEAIQLGLPFDTQTMLYMYCAEQQLGEKIAGVCYDVIRRPQLRLGKNETVQHFIDRVAKEVAKDPKHYFMRWDCTLLKRDLPRWVDRQLVPILNQIAEWWDSIKADPLNPWKSPLHFMNPNALTNQYGRAPLFHLITKGQTFGLVRRKHCYPELED